MELMRVLEDYIDNKDAFQDIDRARRLSKRLSLDDCHGTLLSRIKMSITPFAYKKFLIQYSQKDFYKFSDVYNNEGKLIGWNVRRDDAVPDPPESQFSEELGTVDADYAVGDSKHSIRFVSVEGHCPCQYRITSGIACRHLLCICASKVVDSNSGITGVIGGATIDYWLKSTVSTSLQLVSSHTLPLQSSSSLSSALSKEEILTDVTALATNVVTTILATNSNINRVHSLKEDLKSVLKKYIPDNSTLLNLESEYMSVANPVPKKKQAGRKFGQFEYANGVSKTKGIVSKTKVSSDSNSRKRKRKIDR
jgi:hypothetical protein